MPRNKMMVTYVTGTTQQHAGEVKNTRNYEIPKKGYILKKESNSRKPMVEIKMNNRYSSAVSL